MYNASFSNSNNANKPFNFVYYKYIFKGPYADFLKDESNIRAYSHTLDNAESISLLGTSHVLLPIASLEDTEGFIFLVYFNFYVDTEIEVIEETYRNLNYYSLLTEDIVTLTELFRTDYDIGLIDPDILYDCCVLYILSIKIDLSDIYIIKKTGDIFILDTSHVRFKPVLTDVKDMYYDFYFNSHLRYKYADKWFIITNNNMSDTISRIDNLDIHSHTSESESYSVISERRRACLFILENNASINYEVGTMEGSELDQDLLDMINISKNYNVNDRAPIVVTPSRSIRVYEPATEYSDTSRVISKESIGRKPTKTTKYLITKTNITNIGGMRKFRDKGKEKITTYSSNKHQLKLIAGGKEYSSVDLFTIDNMESALEKYMRRSHTTHTQHTQHTTQIREGVKENTKMKAFYALTELYRMNEIKVKTLHIILRSLMLFVITDIGPANIDVVYTILSNCITIFNLYISSNNKDISDIETLLKLVSLISDSRKSRIMFHMKEVVRLTNKYNLININTNSMEMYEYLTKEYPQLYSEALLFFTEKDPENIVVTGVLFYILFANRSVESIYWLEEYFKIGGYVRRVKYREIIDVDSRIIIFDIYQRLIGNNILLKMSLDSYVLYTTNTKAIPFDATVGEDSMFFVLFPAMMHILGLNYDGVIIDLSNVHLNVSTELLLKGDYDFYLDEYILKFTTKTHAEYVIIEGNRIENEDLSLATQFPV